MEEQVLLILMLLLLIRWMAQGDSVTVTATPMATEELCKQGGDALADLVSGSTKVLRYACIRNQ